MNIKEFANTHNQQTSTVSMYIRRHKELFEGHIKKVGVNLYLDDHAVNLLEEQYSTQKPIVLADLDETQKKYIRALEQNNHLHQQIVQLQTQLQESNSIKLLVEKQDTELEKL